MTIPTGNNNSEINIPVSGAVASVDLGVVIPFGVDGEIPTAVSHGRVSSDGVTISSSNNTTKIFGWPEADVVATIVSEGEVTITFSMLQVQNEDNLELYFNSGVNATTEGYHFDPGAAGAKRQFIIDTIDKVNNLKTRYYFPEANVTERGEIKLAGDGLVEFNVTLTAYAKEVGGVSTTMLYWTGPIPTPSIP